MTPADAQRPLAKFNGNGSASAESIQRLEMEAGLRFPESYVSFLRQTNGGEGFIGSAYLILWRACEVIERNEVYQVSDFAPGLFLFGSDGGGEAFAFDTRFRTSPIVSVPFVGMDLETVQTVASDFQVFLEQLSKS